MASTQGQENDDVLELCIVNLIAIDISLYYQKTETRALYVQIVRSLVTLGYPTFAALLRKSIYGKLGATPQSKEDSNEQFLRNQHELVQHLRTLPDYGYLLSDLSFDNAPDETLDEEHVLCNINGLDDFGILDYSSHTRKQLMVACGIIMGRRCQVLVINGHSLVQSSWLIYDRYRRFPYPRPNRFDHLLYQQTSISQQIDQIAKDIHTIWEGQDILVERYDQFFSTIAENDTDGTSQQTDMDWASEEQNSDDGQLLDAYRVELLRPNSVEIPEPQLSAITPHNHSHKAPLMERTIQQPVKFD